MRPQMRAALLALVIGAGLLGVGCEFLRNPFPWGSYSVSPVVTPATLRFEPGTDVATFQLAEPRANMSRPMYDFPISCLDCPESAVGPIEPAEFTTHGLSPTTITVHVDRTGLAPGEYTGYAYVHTKGIEGTPQDPDGAASVTVVIVVGPG